MEIRRVDIENFRGIKELTWKIPSGRRFQVLIGPGDSTKSTILNAVDMALSDRWNQSFVDSDFYNGDLTQPISIRVTLTDVTSELIQHHMVGLHLNGLDSEGELHQDPQDHHKTCITIALTVDQELEPKWTLFRPDKDLDEARISASMRRLIGSYKIDERIDSHLRWTKTSALGRLTDKEHGAAKLLLDANRMARAAVRQAVPQRLQDLTNSVQGKIRSLGGGEFESLQPGLDQSLTSSSGNLSLHDGDIPLTNFGLGTRRLAGIAAQHLAHDGKSLLFVDEIEYGLEPHRIVNLLSQLRDGVAQGQLFATTHSPVVLRHLDVGDLAVTRVTEAGIVEIRSLEDAETEIQKLLRASPEAFLARHVVIGEGKTEYGVLLGLLEEWDAEASGKGLPVSAALGIEAVEGSGDQTIKRGRLLDELGYKVTLLLDSDVTAVNKKADQLESETDVRVVRWDNGKNVESALCSTLDTQGLTQIIELAISLSDNPEDARRNYLDHLNKHNDSPNSIPNLNVDHWISDSFTIDQARNLVARTAHKKNWFKQVPRGRKLAPKFIAASNDDNSDVGKTIRALQRIILPQQTDFDTFSEDGQEFLWNH